MSLMRAEIGSQPEILTLLQREAGPQIAALAAGIRERRVRLIVLAARGTSDHAAVFGQYFLEYATGLPVALAAPSIVTLYRRPLRLADALVIGLSQSGEAADVCEYLTAGGAGGALTVAITNTAGSTLARCAEHVILCRAGEERALAATKTYTAEMAILAMLGLALASDSAALAGEFAALPARMTETLALEGAIERGVERYTFIDACVVLARGLNQATALETALKIQETSYIGAKGFSAADFLHGPIAMLDARTPVLLFAPSGEAMAALSETAAKVRARGSELIVFSDDPDLLSLGRTAFALPRVAEWMSPFTCIVAAQLFACFLALAKGFDPDHSRGLSKITVTR